jgi:hypothetical protein
MPDFERWLLREPPFFITGHVIAMIKFAIWGNLLTDQQTKMV